MPLLYPYMVYSRRSEKLLSHIEATPAPVLFEGLHTCFHLKEIKEKTGFPCFIRMHNNESEYYALLGKSENNFVQKCYFLWESRIIRIFEPIIGLAEKIFTISPSDTDYFRKQYPKVVYLPAFHPYDFVSSQAGKGDFALYHGNLSVIENHLSAMFLIKEVFSKVQYPLIIAGAAPRKELMQQIARFSHIQLIQNPSSLEMHSLIRQAHMNILPTFQATGIKLKLINALFNGRFVLVNSEMIQNTGLESLCIRCDSSAEFVTQIQILQNREFPDSEVLKRKNNLDTLFSNQKNAELLIKEIFV